MTIFGQHWPGACLRHHFPQPVVVKTAWLAARLGRFWRLGNHGQEGRTWLAKALELVERQAQAARADGSAWARDEIELQARLLFRAGSLEIDSIRAQALLEESLQHYRTLQDLRAIARCLHELGLALSEQGRSEQAKACFTESLDYARRINDLWCQARSLVGLATVWLEENNPQVAAQLAQESMERYRQQQDSRGVISAMIILAQCQLAFGNYRQAAALLEEVLVLDRIITPHSKGGPWTHRILGLVEQMQGNYTRAAECYRRSLLLRQAQQQTAGMAWALEGLVEVAAATKQPLRAAHLSGAAEKLRQQVGSVISADDRPRYEQAIHQVGEALGEAKFQVAWTAGAVLAVEQVVAYALADPTNA